MCDDREQLPWANTPQGIAALSLLNGDNNDENQQFYEQEIIPREPHWTFGPVGVERKAKLLAFVEKTEPESRSFCTQLCQMPNGIGWFGVIGPDGAMRTQGAANVLSMLLPRLSFDELIAMLMNAGASNELILAMDAPLDTMLFAHLERGDLDKVAELLDVATSSSSSSMASLQLSSLLLRAVRGGSVDAIRLLIARGAKFAECSEDDKSAMLTNALMTKNIDMIRFLVETGGVVLRGNSELYYIVAAGLDACRLLLNASTPIDVVKDCLNHALPANSVEITAHCLDLGALPTRDQIAGAIGTHAGFFHLFQARNLFDTSVISRALKMALNNLETAGLLIDAGADFNNPPLVRLAARYASVDVIQLLIKKGVDFRGVPLHNVWRPAGFDDPDMDGLYVPMEYRFRTVQRLSLEPLLVAGADASALDSAGRSTLFNWLVSVGYVTVEDETVAQLLVAATPELPRDIGNVTAHIVKRQEEVASFTSRMNIGMGMAASEPSVDEGLVRFCNALYAAGCAGPFPRGVRIDATLVAEHTSAIERIRYRLVRLPILKICLGLESLGLPALVTLAVVDAALPLAPFVSMHRKWNIITAVKHRN
jgi:ankyrin repeat protein